MNTLIKALVGTATAGAMALSAASPALARDGGHGGISAGTVIASALVIGGVAAIASAVSHDNHAYDTGYGNDYRYDRAGYTSGYGYGSASDAVSSCAQAVQRDAGASSYGRADVTRITGVSVNPGGFDVRGQLSVSGGNRWGGGYDTGSFTCQVRYGRVAGIDYSGIRGLR